MSVIVAGGGVSMMKKTAYGLSMAATILAMLNLGNCCCVIGVPVGLWSLNVLCRREVKDAFGGDWE